MQKRQVSRQTAPVHSGKPRRNRKAGKPPAIVTPAPLNARSMIVPSVPRTKGMFDAFTCTAPLPDSMTFGHFTPCRSYYSFALTTNWNRADITTNSVTQAGVATVVQQDCMLWFNWQPSGVTAIWFTIDSSNARISPVQMIGAPQFFPTSVTSSGVFTIPSGTPQQVRPMRTSIRISNTSVEQTRAGGVTAIIVPQNITLSANPTNITAGISAYGTAANAGAPTSPQYFGSITPFGQTYLTSLLSGSGASFHTASELAQCPMQWDLTPSSFIGFHSYQNWNQPNTPDASPATLASPIVTSTGTSQGYPNTMVYTDLVNFTNDSALNVCNALFLFKGTGLAAQSYNVEVSSMIAARFPANSLLANNSVMPRGDRTGSVTQEAGNLQAAGAAGRPVSGPSGSNRGKMGRRYGSTAGW